MFCKFLTSIFLSVSVAALAGNSTSENRDSNNSRNRNRNCLIQASNEELLDEVYARMSFRQENPPRYQEENIIMEAFCNSSNSMVYSIYQSTTKEKLSSDTVYLGNRCSSVASFIYQRYPKGVIPTPNRFAFCDQNNYLVRATIDKLGKIDFTDKTYVGSSEKCEKAAELFNQN